MALCSRLAPASQILASQRPALALAVGHIMLEVGHELRYVWCWVASLGDLKGIAPRAWAPDADGVWGLPPAFHTLSVNALRHRHPSRLSVDSCSSSPRPIRLTRASR